jgi:LuxR family maltose regulon positive regulatory protein
VDRKITLVSAPAGFGKTTLLGEWVRDCGPHNRAAWLSLDKGDNDPIRFVSYLVAALQTVWPGIGESAAAMLQSSQVMQSRVGPSMRTSPLESALTLLINEVSAEAAACVLVLDDYHVIEAPAVHEALGFFLDHLPHYLHVAIATRADPPLPLARLRARHQLTELRAADLRFTPEEAAAFLNRVMALSLSAEQVAALELVGPASPDLRGERRQATILMTDVEGSTKSVCVPTLSLTGSFTPARISRGRRSDLSRFRCG